MYVCMYTFPFTTLPHIHTHFLKCTHNHQATDVIITYTQKKIIYESKMKKGRGKAYCEQP